MSTAGRFRTTLDELMTLSATIAEAGIIPFAHANAEFRRANEFLR